MRKIVFLLLSLAPYFITAQSIQKKSIDWISISDAERFSEKYNKNMLIFFYRENCDYCIRMKKEVLNDPQIIKLINQNFFPVMINGKGKKPIIYNAKKYINDVSIEEDPNSTWRHNLAFDLIASSKGTLTWPSIAIIDGDNKKVGQLTGFSPKLRLIRYLNRVK